MSESGRSCLSAALRAAVPAVLCAALAGCMVGPDWRAPRAPAEALRYE